QPCERADLAGFTDVGAVDDGVRLDHSAGADAAVADQAVRADAHTGGQAHVAFQHGVHIQYHVFAALHGATNVQPRRVQHSDPGAHQLFRLDLLVDAFQACELHPVVDAVDFPGELRLYGFHGQAGVDRHGNHVGEVVLTLGVVAGEFGQGVRQEGTRAGEDAGVDFADRALGVVGVLELDDRLHFAGGVADDAAVGARLVHFQGHQGQPVGSDATDEVAQGVRADQGHVTVQDQHHIFADVRHGLRHRMAGAELLGLFGPDRVRGRDLFAHQLAAVAVDDADTPRVQRPGTVDDVREHRPAGNRVRHLWQLRAHPGALAGGKDDHCKFHLLPRLLTSVPRRSPQGNGPAEA